MSGLWLGLCFKAATNVSSIHLARHAVDSESLICKTETRLSATLSEID